MYNYNFRATGYPYRLYSGTNALDRLPDEVARHKAGRAFIVCGRTVSRKTPLLADMRPWGNYTAPEMHDAGGMAVVAKRLLDAGLLNGDAPTERVELKRVRLIAN